LDTSVVAQRPAAVAGRRWRPFSSPAPEGDAWGGRYYYLKHAPFVYSKSAMRAVNTLFRPQILKTYTHKFRNGACDNLTVVLLLLLLLFSLRFPGEKKKPPFARTG
jgi:hypothetical protein